MTGKFIIRLEDLHFYARIGVEEEERKVGNEFIVNVKIITDASRFIPENLETTISYAEVYDIIRYVMEQQWLLLESASQTIAAKIRQRWPIVWEVHVKIAKVSPPISGIQGSCSVEIIS